MNPIKQRVAAYSAETGTTRREIAKRLKMAPSTFYEKLDGQRSDFSLKQAKDLADILGCSIDQLSEPLIEVRQ